jgi:hypothetical protein
MGDGRPTECRWSLEDVRGEIQPSKKVIIVRYYANNFVVIVHW